MSLDSSKFNPEKWPSVKVRETFINFFENKKEHRRVPSSPVVPHDDPTLLFTNAGMNQFKDIFTGQVDPNSPMADCKRAVDSQKCIRAGGKHNDLDDVGKDSYHHTFFEMLGTWSFGNYFKKEAIEWAWELLTEVYQLPKDRLYATYFEGDEQAGIPCDEEARDLWLKFLPPSQVMPFDKKDNFWEMGDVGPCGPCTEIHFDIVGNRDASKLVNMDDPTVIEIWNLVFMQFNRSEDGTLHPLPAKHVDTGMGFERICAVLQNYNTNYDTDVFTAIFDEIQKVTGDKAGYGGKYEDEDKDSHDMAYRVIADHIRTLTFAITDGATPNNEGRGYVLRRVVRRAVRYGTQCLNAPTGFFSQLVGCVVAKMSDVFPEIKEHQQNVEKIIKREEDLFMRTLDKGTKRLTKVLETLEPNKDGKKVLDGAAMWDLYSTYGFPVDLTQLMCEERGVGVDKEGYEAASAAFRVQRSTGGSSAVAMPKLGVHATDELKTKGVTVTDDKPKYVPEERSITAKVVALFANDSFADSVSGVKPADGQQYVGVLLDRTNFYAEAGGQVADLGEFRVDGKAVFDVVDVQSFAGYVLHIGTIRGESTLNVGDAINTAIDSANRERVTANHTITHVLNWSLRRVVGQHVEQKGSKVVAELTRFDFANDGPVSVDQLKKVDELVREVIARNDKVYYQEVPLEQGRNINGLTAVFGEKYPDPVRVVTIGVSIEEILKNPSNDWGSQFSIEFCGGTHLATMGLAGGYCTISEGGISQGVRRIIGVTGADYQDAIDNAKELSDRLEALEKNTEIAEKASKEERNAITAEIAAQSLPAVAVADLQARLQKLSKAAIAKQKNAANQQKAASGQFITDFIAKRKEEGDNAEKFIALNIASLSGNMKLMKNAAQQLKKECNVPVAIVSADDSSKKPKVVVVTVVTDDLLKTCKAGDWANGAVSPFGGRGGGRPNEAQATHVQLDKVEETVTAARDFIQSKL